jgi:DNA-binding transcriptional ArsR family regulator
MWAGMANCPYIAEIAALIGDPGRANMLAALLDGRSLTATELGLAAGVAPSTASGHLGRLCEGKLISAARSGRHRYYRLASPAVARTLENLMALASESPTRFRRKLPRDETMARARTCYDHLAGRLGVALTSSLVERGQLILEDDGGMVTMSGRDFFRGFGLDLDERRSKKRALCRPCLDWSERQWHVAGSLGALIAGRCIELGWTKRQPVGRALTITPEGERGFSEMFGISV